MRTALPLAALLGLLFALGGCGVEDQTIPVRRELVDARDRLARSQQQLLDTQKENQRLAEQVQTLQSLGDKRLDELYVLKKVRVGDYSTGIDTDGKTGDDAVKVYVETADQYYSAIKAAGLLTIQLYDLAAPAGQNLLAECTLGPKELGNKWINGFMSQSFIVECPWKTPPAHEDITVRIAFTDLLTGVKFTDQHVVKVSLAPVGAAASQPATQPSTKPTTQPGK